MRAGAARLTAIAAIPLLALAAAAPRDPYIWLEQADSPRAIEWVKQENAHAAAVLQGDPLYAGFYADALKIVRAEDRIPKPELLGGQIINFWRDADHVHGLWRITNREDFADAGPHWRTLIDLDELSKTEGRNWVWKGATCEPVHERRCLIALSESGEDAVTMREFDVAAARFVEGGFTLPRSKQRVAWRDDDTLILSRDWGPGTMTASGYPFVLKTLARGEPLAAARELFRGAATDQVSVEPATLVDGRGRKATLFTRSPTFFESETYLLDASGTHRLPIPRKASIKGMVGGRLIVEVREAWQPAGEQAIAPGSLVALDLATLGKGDIPKVETIFAPTARRSVLQSTVTRDHVVAAVFDNVRGRAFAFARGDTGWTAKHLPLPDNVSTYFAAATGKSDWGYLTVTGFLDPETLWAFDALSGTAQKIKVLPSKFDASLDTVDQYEAVSNDGTHIPYFVVHRRDLKTDGTTPTILTGYGGFQVPNIPQYDGAIGKLWLERGGAYAVANIRGGGEFGPAWHEAGLKTKRQRIYDDFAAVGCDMIRRGLTSKRRLGITGGSNGGLLVGVEFIQHPELWQAVMIRVPLLDMLRYEKIAAGASWVAEYGSVTVPEERAFLEKTSPYANLRRVAAYPEPFLWTTTKDDRVGPGHARKFAARMKELGLPYLYYENIAGGHSGDADLEQVAERNALTMVYFSRMLGLTATWGTAK